MSRDDQDCPSPTLSVSSVDSEDSVLLTPPLQLDEYQDGWDWNPPQRPPAGAIASRDIHTGLTPRLMSVSLRPLSVALSPPLSSAPLKRPSTVMYPPPDQPAQQQQLQHLQTPPRQQQQNVFLQQNQQLLGAVCPQQLPDQQLHGQAYRQSPAARNNLFLSPSPAPQRSLSLSPAPTAQHAHQMPYLSPSPAHRNLSATPEPRFIERRGSIDPRYLSPSPAPMPLSEPAYYPHLSTPVGTPRARTLSLTPGITMSPAMGTRIPPRGSPYTRPGTPSRRRVKFVEGALVPGRFHSPPTVQSSYASPAPQAPPLIPHNYVPPPEAPPPPAVRAQLGYIDPTPNEEGMHLVVLSRATAAYLAAGGYVSVKAKYGSQQYKVCASPTPDVEPLRAAEAISRAQEALTSITPRSVPFVVPQPLRFRSPTPPPDKSDDGEYIEGPRRSASPRLPSKTPRWSIIQ